MDNENLIMDFCLWDKKTLPFETMSLLLYCMSVKFGVPTLKQASRMVTQLHLQYFHSLILFS